MQLTIKHALKSFVLALFYCIATLPLLLLVLVIPKRKQQLIWGTVPMTNNKYWSNAVKCLGYRSVTLMDEYYHFHKKEDFDLYLDDFVTGWIWPAFLKTEIARVLAFVYVIRNASVLHLCFLGGPLWATWLRGIEGHLYRWAGVRTVVLPYGGDMYMYSRIMDPCVRHGLLLSYPSMATKEKDVEKRVEYWVRHADAIVMGFNIDGIGRWDVLVGNMICIDLKEWPDRVTYSSNNGYNGPVKVLHAPNHRGVKGSEFLLEAVEELKAEGLQIELVLLEKVPNERIKSIMQDVDILADQFILPGYGLFAVEGMASGLPVLANLSDVVYMRLFRRYSYLNECPILSTTPENLKQILRSLVADPSLREELGRASRKYAQKYHSYDAAGYLFGSIYDKLLKGKDVDLQNLFHPMISDYVRKSPIHHPLLQSRLAPPSRQNV